MKLGISLPNVSLKESPEVEDLNRGGGGGGGCFDCVAGINVQGLLSMLLCLEKVVVLVMGKGRDLDGSNGDCAGRLLLVPSAGNRGKELALELDILI